MKHPGWHTTNVPRETLSRLEVFADLLLRWNARINLVSRADEPLLMERHIGDALQMIPWLPGSIDRAIDLGSGGGFPGLVLSIATNVRFDLVEADKRKAAFLQEASRATFAPTTIHAVRVEAASLAQASLVTARAFAPLPRLLELGHRFVAPGGCFLLPKGKAVDRELTEACAGWSMRVERFASQTDNDATILRLSEVQRG